MARYIFRGDAEVRPDIFKVTVNASIPGARYGLKVWNRILASVTAVQDESIDLLTERFRVAVADVGLDTTAGEGDAPDYFTLTGTAGEALGPASDSSPGCYVEILRHGVATISQKIRIVMPVGASGGTWLLSIQAPGESLCTTYTMAYNVTEANLKTELEFALNEYGGVMGTGSSVTLVNPGSSTASRVYEVEMGGDFSGIDFTFTPNGDALQGTATVTARTVQLAAGSATAIQAMRTGVITQETHGMGIAYDTFALQFTREGVTSRVVRNIYSTRRNINNPEAWKTCMSDMPDGEAISANITAALADICGPDKVTWRLWMRDGGITIVVKWNFLGGQSPITMKFCNNYDYPLHATWFSASTEVVRASGENQNEFLLMPFASAQNPDFTVTITKAATSFTITQLDSQATLQTKWQTAFGSGNVTVHGRDIIEFTGSQANIDQAAITYQYAASMTFVDNYGSTTVPGSTDFNAVVLCDGVPYVNEIQSVVIKADGGTFTASSNGTTYTSGLAWNLSAATFQTALRGLTAIGTGNCTVTGSGTDADPFMVEYISGKAATDMPLLVFNTGSLLGAFDPEIIVIGAADPGVTQLDKIVIDPNATSGTLRPQIGGVTGGSVAYNGSAANWTTAIELIPSTGVTVTGVDGGPFFVEYDAAGAKLMTLDQSLLVVSESTLFSMEQIQEASGPNHYNEPLNWSPQGVPGTDDTPVFMDSSSSLTEALRQRCTWTAETSTGDLRLGTNVNDCGDFYIGQKVRITTTGSFPSATLSGSGHTLSASTDYYVVTIDRFRRRMGISTSRSGATIELTNAGSGVHTVTVRWTKIEQRKSHNGNIGLSRRLGNGWEERPRYLVGESPLVEIGAGETGNGTNLCFIDLGTLAGQAEIWHSGRGNTGEQAIQLRTNSSSIDVRARGGELGLGTDDVDVVVGDLVAQTATVVLGRATLTSIDLTSCDHSFPQGVTVSGTVRIVQ